MSELIPTMPQLSRLEDGFHSFYICTAVRKFLFFLDPKRLGKVRIVDILASGFLDDLLELRDEEDQGDKSTRTNDTDVSGEWITVFTVRNDWCCNVKSANVARVGGSVALVVEWV